MIPKTGHPTFYGIAAASLFLIGGVGGASATVITEATSTFDWSTFTITLDAGMSLTTVGQASYATAFTHFSSTGFADSETSPASDWSTDLTAGAVSTSATYDLSGKGRVDAGNDTMTGSASFDGAGVFSGTGNELLQAQGGAQRDFRFTVSGDGVLSFSIDYTHDTAASNTGPGAGVAAASSVLSLNNLSNDNGILLDSTLPDEAVATLYTTSYADALLGESVFDSDFGTLSLSATVSDGAEMLFIAQAFSDVFYQVPRQAVPEPATLALLGLGIAGLVFSRRKHAQRLPIDAG